MSKTIRHAVTRDRQGLRACAARAATAPRQRAWDGSGVPEYTQEDFVADWATGSDVLYEGEEGMTNIILTDVDSLVGVDVHWAPEPQWFDRGRGRLPWA